MYERFRGIVLSVFEELKAEGILDDQVVVFRKDVIRMTSLPNLRECIIRGLLILRFEGYLGTFTHYIDVVVQEISEEVYQESNPFMKGNSGSEYSRP